MNSTNEIEDFYPYPQSKQHNGLVYTVLVVSALVIAFHYLFEARVLAHFGV